MIHFLTKNLGMTYVGVCADDTVFQYRISDPGKLPMYLIIGTYHSEGKIKWNGIVHHSYIQYTKGNDFDCF